MRIGSRIVTLIALAAIASVAFALPSAAAAGETSLCSADQNPCEEANIITHVHETSVGKAILLASPKIECLVLFLGEVVGEGETGQVEIEGNFTYTSCGSGCTVTEQSASSGIEVSKTGHEIAEVTGKGEVHVNCIGINCYFDGEGLVATAKGLLLSTAANGEVSLQEQTVHKTKGNFCPSTAKLDITTTPLSGTHISGGLTATSTSISTSLTGGGKEGTEITVPEGTKVKDTATLSGTNVSSATGTVDYAVYQDKECKELAAEAGKGKVEGTKA
ncbi:MAG TPA: hypothetical protein VFJ64_06350, partial [Solirubrobacterales bacterium]|nr:hypothetical protein [Solirubrobacterales bacterium]